MGASRFLAETAGIRQNLSSIVIHKNVKTVKVRLVQIRADGNVLLHNEDAAARLHYAEQLIPALFGEREDVNHPTRMPIR